MAQQPPNAAFQRVDVDFKVLGQSRVTWEMARHFLGVAPLNFQLQWGWTGSSSADDWEDVEGAAGTNVFTLTDPKRRAYGKMPCTHYRVKLATGDGRVLFSEPASIAGVLSKREWLEAREIIFREQLVDRTGDGVEGYLLKAKRHGPPCPICLDVWTGEVQNSHCDTCKGTRFVQGYYKAIPLTFTQLDDNPTREHVDLQQNRGTVRDDTKKGRFIGCPQLYSYDVWVCKDSDERYYLHEIATICHIRGVPLAFSAELRLAAWDDVIYTVSLEGS